VVGSDVLPRDLKCTFCWNSRFPFECLFLLDLNAFGNYPQFEWVHSPFDIGAGMLVDNGIVSWKNLRFDVGR